MKKLLLTLVISHILVGCAGISADRTQAGLDQAGYRYEKTTAPDGTVSCRVEIASGREVAGGNISVDPDCALHANSETLTGNKSTEAMLQLLLRIAPLLSAP